MKMNPEKYHLLINNNKESYENNNITITIWKVDWGQNRSWIKFQWTSLILVLCKKACQKLNALSRITYCMTFDHRRLILNACITSHFSYCPIFHERTPTISYKNFKSSFQGLLIEAIWTNSSLFIYLFSRKRFCVHKNTSQAKIS